MLEKFLEVLKIDKVTRDPSGLRNQAVLELKKLREVYGS